MKKLQNYQPKNNVIVKYIPFNLIYDRLGKEVLKLHNSRFKSRFKDSYHIEDLANYKKDQPISYSNTPRNISYNQIIRELTNNIHVLNPIEIIANWNDIPELNSTYSDSDSVAIYPNKGPNEDLRKLVLSIINKQNTDIPLIVSGLGVEKSDNNHGFTFTETDYINVIEAPFLRKTCKLAVKDGKLIESDNGIQVYVSSSQGGLHRLCRGRSGRLDAWDDDLLGSDGAGRVNLISGEAASQKNLEAKLKQFQKEKDKELAEINIKYKKFKEELKEFENKIKALRAKLK